MGCTESRDAEPKARSGRKKLTTKRKRNLKGSSTNQGGRQEYDFHGVVDEEAPNKNPRKKRNGGSVGKHSVTGSGRTRSKVDSRGTSNTLSQTQVSGDGDQEGAPLASIMGATTAMSRASGEHPNPLALPEGSHKLQEQSLGSDDGVAGGNGAQEDSHTDTLPKSKSPLTAPSSDLGVTSLRTSSSGNPPSSNLAMGSQRANTSSGNTNSSGQHRSAGGSVSGFGVQSARRPYPKASSRMEPQDAAPHSADTHSNDPKTSTDERAGSSSGYQVESLAVSSSITSSVGAFATIPQRPGVSAPLGGTDSTNGLIGEGAELVRPGEASMNSVEVRELMNSIERDATDAKAKKRRQLEEKLGRPPAALAQKKDSSSLGVATARTGGRPESDAFAPKPQRKPQHKLTTAVEFRALESEKQWSQEKEKQRSLLEKEKQRSLSVNDPSNTKDNATTQEEQPQNEGKKASEKTKKKKRLEEKARYEKEIALEQLTYTFQEDAVHILSFECPSIWGLIETSTPKQRYTWVKWGELIEPANRLVAKKRIHMRRWFDLVGMETKNGTAIDRMMVTTADGQYKKLPPMMGTTAAGGGGGVTVGAGKAEEDYSNLNVSNLRQNERALRQMEAQHRTAPVPETGIRQNSQSDLLANAARADLAATSNNNDDGSEDSRSSKRRSSVVTQSSMGDPTELENQRVKEE